MAYPLKSSLKYTHRATAEARRRAEAEARSEARAKEARRRAEAEARAIEAEARWREAKTPNRKGGRFVVYALACPRRGLHAKAYTTNLSALFLLISASYGCVTAANYRADTLERFKGDCHKQDGVCLVVERYINVFLHLSYVPPRLLGFPNVELAGLNQVASITCLMLSLQSPHFKPPPSLLEGISDKGRARNAQLLYGLVYLH